MDITQGRVCQGTCVNDPWTKTKGVLNAGGREWVGQGRVMGGKGTTVIEQQ